MNLIFHQAALGDFALILPLLRALEPPTTLIAPWSRGRLAASLIPGLRTFDIEMFEFTRLHSAVGPSTISPAIAELFSQASNILTFVANDDDQWVKHVNKLAPNAELIALPTRLRPVNDGGSVVHIADLHMTRLRERGIELANVPMAITGDVAGPTVVHPGSGGEAKCWPRDRFGKVIERLREAGRPVRILLGEAEVERWPTGETAEWQERFDAAICVTLPQLLEQLMGASGYLGNDAGPTHVAAQLGLPTTALFGPTDPRVWAPRGPAVTVVAPPSPRAMDWLEIEQVVEAIGLS